LSDHAQRTDGLCFRSSRSMPVGNVVGQRIVTIEGLSPDGNHPVQKAWKDLDVPQCGPRLSDEDKKGLWILIISAMTHYESSCIYTGKAKGPNGIAAGLLQLHRGKEARYSRGCRNGDSGSAERSLICGISMINDQIEEGRPLFSPNSYWEVLRPTGRSKKAKKIMAVIGQYPACQIKAEIKPQIQTEIKPESNKKIGVSLTK
jgi:hypothetical protein